MSSLEIITTSDGSHTLRNTDLNETYHSRHGAIQESVHVFIRSGLDFFCDRFEVSPIRILEVGFGTGLNALLTLQWTLKRNREIHYTSLETHPLPEVIVSHLNYPDVIGSAEHFSKLHAAPWDSDTVISPFVILRKVKESLQDVSLAPSSFDIVFFDAFAPSKQPGIWDISLLRKVAIAMKPNGVFVTYCAKGQVKRDLREIGLVVETLPGPPGKEQMTRAGKYLT
ncbi:MAG: tRNA (5-methylaminomethyl-2-thiouridine)(34)-methyltransferase MnmD [Cyclobacteriaceae bacterium]